LRTAASLVCDNATSGQPDHAAMPASAPGGRPGPDIAVNQVIVATYRR
jgi:hypothetical protein